MRLGSHHTIAITSALLSVMVSDKMTSDTNVL